MGNRGIESWNIGKSEDLYTIKNWGKGYFGVNKLGHVTVHPTKDPDKSIDLKQLIDEVVRRGINAPVLLRFTDILQHRLGEINSAFTKAIADTAYQNKYCCVYPIKVNQQRHVVEEVFNFGAEYGFGLEAGSKPELLAVLALVDDEVTPIICNGFKDAAFCEAVVLGQKLGKRIIPVIEKYSELELLLNLAEKYQVRPLLGVRSKLSSKGSGKWESSAGSCAKFGLTIGEIVRVLDELKSRNMADCLKLLHFHIGSQVTNIRNIKDAVNEGARLFAELHRSGAGMEYLDVGGGLGIDYDGSQTNFGSSINYTLAEYASDVVYGVQTVCDQSQVPHPIIITESGRAVAAYHSLLVFNVIGMAEVGETSAPPRPEGELPRPIEALYDTLGDLTAKNVLECYHDAVKSQEDALTAFNLGYLNLQDRYLAEQLFWTISREIQKISRRLDRVPEDLEALESILADTYFCNYSLFQSMPDSWAIDQLFPIIPIHRLGEKPDRKAVLADITCDSDGKVDKFIDLKDVKSALDLHGLNNEPYYLGAFLIGAYQEILGDLHNLFGDTHAIHVRLSENGRPAIDTVVKGDTVREVLSYVQFSAEDLFARVRKHIEKAFRHDRITSEEAGRYLQFYENGLESYTYLS